MSSVSPSSINPKNKRSQAENSNILNSEKWTQDKLSDTSQRFEITLQGDTMGTSYTIKYIHELHLPMPVAIKAHIEKELQEIDKQMSTYRSDSCISQFNQYQKTGKPFAITADFATVVKESIRLHALTCGGLDITLTPLTWLYGFGGRHITHLPDDEACQKAEQAVGMNKFACHSDGKTATLTKHHPSLALDLSAIAKGFGVDKIAAYLDSLSVAHYLIEIGGELFGKGHNLANELWQVGIYNSTDNTVFETVVCLDGVALATSGNYQDYYQDELGRTFCHILHPITKTPIQSNLVSVSVIAPTTMMADGIATGLYALGAEQALQIANANKLAVFLIIHNPNGEYRTEMSEAFRPYIRPISE